MAEVRIPRVDQGQTKIRNVPIAVTPEGFWCCPSPAVFQKIPRTQPPLNKPNPSIPKKQTPVTPKKLDTIISSVTDLVTNEQTIRSSDAPARSASVKNERTSRPKPENVPRKVTIEFGEPGTSDLKLILIGKQGLTVKLSVHRSVLVESSGFFAKTISEQQPVFPCLEIDDCEDVEIYVETIGLMYCKEMKPRLIKQSVSRVLRILKIAEQLGFLMCVQSCLEYLEAVPWVGEEEEERVVSSVLNLETEGRGVGTVLKRVSSDISKPRNDTLSHVLDLVLKSNEEKGRREMKSVVLKLLKENNTLCRSSTSNDSSLSNHMLYKSCMTALQSLLSLFRQAAKHDSTDSTSNAKMMFLESDNLLWLLDILADRQAADEFAVMWASQQELASLHEKLPVPTRHAASSITARLFVGIGRGELLPTKDTRHLLLQTWLQPLIEDYKWLKHGSRPFESKVVEEGLGRTILTLPLEDQQSFLLSWLGSFLKLGDDCPNLQKAFEVWWRRTFIRPYAEAKTSTSKMEEQ